MHFDAASGGITMLTLGDSFMDVGPSGPLVCPGPDCFGATVILAPPPPATPTPTNTPIATPTIPPTATPTPCVQPDADSDGFTDCPKLDHQGPANTNPLVDNCPAVANPAQTNSDGNFTDLTPPRPGDDITWINSDMLGDACDPDDDNDGLPDGIEPIAFIFCLGTTGPTSPTDRDSDGDRYVDIAECIIGTDAASSAFKPTQAQCITFSGAFPALASTDTDGDGVKDHIEFCQYNSNQLAGGANTDGTAEYATPPYGAGPFFCDDGREVMSVDVNRNVNAADLGIVASAFGAYPIPYNVPPAGVAGSNVWRYNTDVDKNGTVNAADLGLVASRFGSCP